MAAENNKRSTGKRVVGKPFEKGKSGNPGGRPKGLVALMESKYGRCEKFFDVCAKIALGKLTITKHALQTGDAYDAEPDFKDRREAAEVILAYRWGKPRATMELSGPDGGPIQTQEAGPDLSKLTDDELKKIERIFSAADTR